MWSKRTKSASDAGLVLPDGCLDVLFHLGESPRAIVIGAMTRATALPAAPIDVVAVRFRIGAAARFFGAPVCELTDHRVALEDLGIDPRPTLERLLDARTLDEQRIALEELVAARAGPPCDRLVERAVARLVSPHPPAIAALAAELGVTRQHLARRVARAVGIGPKELTRVARVQRIASALASGRRDYAALAIEHGLYDQAHLVHEMRDIVGLTPAAFATSGSILPITSPLDVAFPASR